MQGIDAALRRHARLQGELHEPIVIEAVARLEGRDVDEADALASRDFLHQGIGHVEAADPWPVTCQAAGDGKGTVIGRHENRQRRRQWANHGNLGAEHVGVYVGSREADLEPVDDVVPFLEAELAQRLITSQAPMLWPTSVTRSFDRIRLRVRRTCARWSRE